MSHVVIGYDKDGHKIWGEHTPSRGRIPWTVSGSFAGSPAIADPTPARSRDRIQAAHDGWAKRRTAKA